MSEVLFKFCVILGILCWIALLFLGMNGFIIAVIIIIAGLIFLLLHKYFGRENKEVKI